MAQENIYEKMDPRGSGQGESVPLSVLEPIIGAPKPPEKPTETFRDPTPEERAKFKLDPNRAFQVNAVTGEIKDVPGQPPAKATPPLSPQKIPGLVTALKGIQDLRRLSKNVLSVGEAAGRVRETPLIGALFGQNRADLETAIDLVQTGIINDKVAELAALNQGGVSGMVNTREEATRLAASVANLNPNQSLPEFEKGINRAEEYYRNQLINLGQDPDALLKEPEAKAEAGGQEGPVVTVTREQSVAAWGEPFKDEAGNYVGAGFTGVAYDANGRARVIGSVSDTNLDQPAPSFYESAISAVTGADKATPTTEALPDWVEMPGINNLLNSGAWATGLGTAFGGSPMEIAQIVQSNFPGTQVFQDEKGNYILRSAIDGRDYAIKPGFQVSDIPRALSVGLAGLLTGGGGSSVVGTAAREAALQTGIESTQAATGGTFNPADIAAAGAFGAAGQKIANVAPSALQRIRNMRGGDGGMPPPSGGMPSGGPAAPSMAFETPAAPPMAQAPGRAVIREDNVFRGNGTPKISVDVTDQPFVVRSTSQSQIDDMINSGLVRPKPGGYGKDNKATLYFGESDTALPNTVFAKPTDERFVIVGDSAELVGKEGNIPIDKLRHVWHERDGQVVDILPEIIAKNNSLTRETMGGGGLSAAPSAGSRPLRFNVAPTDILERATTRAKPSATVLDDASIADRELVLDALGIPPENRRLGALTGNKTQIEDEVMVSKLGEGSERMQQQFELESRNLGEYALDLVDRTGGTLNLPPLQRGVAIVKPLEDYQTWYNQQIRNLYSQADTAAKESGVPITLEGLDDALKVNSTFGSKSSLMSLRRGVRQYLREQGIIDPQGKVLPVDTQTAERVRQYLNNQWSPETSGVIGMLKGKIDDDVISKLPVDVYAGAREMRRNYARVFEEPKSIAQLLDISGPEGVNRRVALDVVGDKLNNLAQKDSAQFNYIINTLGDLPPELQQAGQQAIAEIRANILESILKKNVDFEDISQGGDAMWRGTDLSTSKELDKYKGKLANIFSPEVAQRLETLRVGARILRPVDPNPSGTATTSQRLLSQKKEAAIRSGSALVGGGIGGLGGPTGAMIGAAVGERAGARIAQTAENRAREAAIARSLDPKAKAAHLKKMRERNR